MKMMLPDITYFRRSFDRSDSQLAADQHFKRRSIRGLRNTIKDATPDQDVSISARDLEIRLSELEIIDRIIYSRENNIPINVQKRDNVSFLRFADDAVEMTYLLMRPELP